MEGMISFNAITRDRFMAIRDAAAAKLNRELPVTDDGQVTADGFNVSWAFVDNNGLLMVTINDKPWWCGEGTAEEFITNFVNSVN